MSTLKIRKAPKKWEEDGVNGGKSSLDIILDWITTGTNYSRWKGDSEGATKETLCGEVVSLMNDAKIYHRKNADIRAKLSEFQTSYNKARDWSENTGEGIRGSKDEDAAEKNIKGIDFKYLIYT